MHAGLLLNIDGQLEQDAGECRIIFVCNRVGGQERMDAEVLDALLLHILERLDQLLAGHAVLGFLRRVHDLVFENEVAAALDTPASCAISLIVIFSAPYTNPFRYIFPDQPLHPPW